MSRVSVLDNDDWTFGQGTANYIKGDVAIRQNVKTRLLSFAGDWFLDLQANIDWILLLSSRNSQTETEGAIRRVVLDTENVVKINNFKVDLNVKKRAVSVTMSVSTIFSKDLFIQTEIFLDGST